MRLLRTLTLIALLLPCAARGAEDAPPNIVLIVSDDQAWTDYGFMGHPHIQTPRLDQLARESLTFTRGYVPDSLCRPSLASIITGQYPHQHGIVGNDPPLPADVMDLPERRPASPAYAAAREAYLQHIDRAAPLPQLLGQHGYLSFQSGKWWEGHYSRGGFTHGMTHGDITRGGRHGDAGLAIGRQGLEPIFDFVRMAQQQQKPFLVWYAPLLPHAPHNPPDEILNRYRGLSDSEFVARYWAMCEWFDQTCGELLDFLDQQQLTENTLVIYVTDNGWINSTDSDRFAPRSKRSPYEGGIRTPLMVRWPGRIEAQRDEHTLVSSLDIVPTILAAAGLRSETALPGLDVANGKALAARRQVFGEIFEHDIQHMTEPLPSLMYRWTIRDNWKLILPHPPRISGGTPDLYDLDRDPHEKQNLATMQPDVVEQLTADLNQWWPTDDAARANAREDAGE